LDPNRRSDQALRRASAGNAIDLDLPEGGVEGFVGPSGDGEALGHPISRPAADRRLVGALNEAPAF